MTPAWAQRQKELLNDCVVSPAVFLHMMDRLDDFVAPYQHALKTEASQRNIHLYLQGLLSHLPRKNAEDIATLVDVERLVLQELSVPPPGIIARWCTYWLGKWSISWGNPMVSSPLIRAASRSAARIRSG